MSSWREYQNAFSPGQSDSCLRNVFTYQLLGGHKLSFISLSVGLPTISSFRLLRILLIAIQSGRRWSLLLATLTWHDTRGKSTPVLKSAEPRLYITISVYVFDNLENLPQNSEELWTMYFSAVVVLVSFLIHRLTFPWGGAVLTYRFGKSAFCGYRNMHFILSISESGEETTAVDIGQCLPVSIIPHRLTPTLFAAISYLRTLEAFSITRESVKTEGVLTRF